MEWVLASQYAWKIGQNSLKKLAKSHSDAFKLQSIATSSVIWIITHLYTFDKYVNVLYMQLNSSETNFFFSI